MNTPISLKLSLIRTDAGTQSRAGINEDVVADYAERMLEGDKFPPAVVFHDGTNYFLADGFHRVLASVRNGFLDILADIRKGTRADALRFSLGANQSNGLRRSNADKRFAVWLALKEFPTDSSVTISKLCGVSHTFVDNIRQPATVAGCERVGADGKTRKLPVKFEPEPETPIAIAPEPALRNLDADFVKAIGGEKVVESFKSTQLPPEHFESELDALLKLASQQDQKTRTRIILKMSVCIQELRKI